MADRNGTMGGLRRLGIAAWSLLGTILLLGVVGWFLLQFWIIVPSVVIAFVMVYVLNPVVERLHRRGVARWLGSCLSYTVLLGLLTLLGYLVIPSIVDQGRELADNFPTIYDDLVTDLEELRRPARSRGCRSPELRRVAGAHLRQPGRLLQ